MKTFLVLFLSAALIATATAIPGTCNQCIPSVNAGDDLATCDSVQQNINCSHDNDYAIGTSHCFTVALRFKRVNGSKDIHTAVARGCIDCFNKAVACYSFAARLQKLTNWTMLDWPNCNMECCDSANCNNHNVTVLPVPTAPDPSAASPVDINSTVKANVSRYSVSGILIFVVAFYYAISLF